jgi:hypothetical protein
VITGLKATQLVQATGQGLRFEGCTTGIDVTGNTNGLFNLIDSSATNTQALISAGASTGAWGSLVLENVIVDSTVPAVCAELMCPQLELPSNINLPDRQVGWLCHSYGIHYSWPDLDPRKRLLSRFNDTTEGYRSEDHFIPACSSCQQHRLLLYCPSPNLCRVRRITSHQREGCLGTPRCWRRKHRRYC